MARTHITLSAAMRARDVSRPRGTDDAPAPSATEEPAESAPVTTETRADGTTAPASRDERGSAGSPPAQPSTESPEPLVVPPAPVPKGRGRGRRRGGRRRR
ncbi:hypothetical protein [Salinactinospora qingdaonensis]